MASINDTRESGKITPKGQDGSLSVKTAFWKGGGTAVTTADQYVSDLLTVPGNSLLTSIIVRSNFTAGNMDVRVESQRRNSEGVWKKQDGTDGWDVVSGSDINLNSALVNRHESVSIPDLQGPVAAERRFRLDVKTNSSDNPATTEWLSMSLEFVNM